MSKSMQLPACRAFVCSDAMLPELLGVSHHTEPNDCDKIYLP